MPSPISPATGTVERNDLGGYKVFDVKKDYGAVGDGSTEDYTAVAAAITAAYNANGGVVYFPPGTYKISTQLAINNNGASPPKQPTIILKGAGSEWDSALDSTNLAGNSLLDLRATTTPGKIDTRGRGVLIIEDLGFIDGSSAATPPPFIQTTNTALLITRCSFAGNSTQGGTAGVQDAIVLGGTTQTIDGSATAAFQGYGTVIEKVQFRRIRRGVYGRAFCNSVALNDLTFSISCGGTTAGAIEFDGSAGGASCQGNIVKGALIEVINYTYGIVLKNANYNAFYGVTLWDNGSATVQLAGTAGNSLGNQFIGCTINGITDTGTANDYYWLDPKARQMYFGTNTSRLAINAATAEITTPAFQSKQNYTPSFGASANFETLSIKSGAVGSALEGQTATGGNHQPYVEFRDDKMILGTGLGLNGIVQISGGHLYWDSDNTWDIGKYDTTQRPRDMYLARNLFLQAGLAGGSAAAGAVGEQIKASVVQGSAVALTTATPKTVTSISLTAGDWDVTAIGATTGAATGTAFDVAIGTTTNSLTGTVLGDSRCQTPTVSLTGADASLMIPAFRVSISSTTTYYLVVQETFTVGSPAAYGRISARRAR